MQNWKQFEKDAFDYIDGLMTPEGKKDFKTQIEADSERREFCNQMRELRSYLTNLQPVKISHDFDTVLRTRIRMERSISRRGLLSSPFRTPAIAFAGAVAVLLFFVYTNFDQSTNNPTLPASQVIRNTENTKSLFQQNQVVFPMDMVQLPSPSARGTSIDSETMERRSRFQPDSVRHSPNRALVHSYEF